MSESYEGTRGYSGGAASEDAAIAERDSGRTSEMMDRVLRLVYMRGGYGATSAELRNALPDEHHGRITSALTKLHIAGEIAALRERRGNCGVYVVKGRESGREVRPYRRQNVKLQIEDVKELLEAHWYTPTRLGTCACGKKVDRVEHFDHLAEEVVALSKGELT